MLFTSLMLCGLGPLISSVFGSAREMQFTPEELLGMLLNYSRGLAQDFAGQLAFRRRCISVYLNMQSMYSFLPPAYRTTNQRCSDHSPGLLQPGRAQGSPAGCTDGGCKGPSTHQRQHRCGLELWGVQEKRH